ncbi:hypothetical protein [Alkalimarinus alittae]|uniref:Uncharacterized protein n=1 Tax=Alkalimarinus alittae TaxID=2961619 RepID=A0ABY6N595_9ALTE|nr:hypothetical protein [Alkalimarinus alittae]UZE97259.1 hypothetical protein NKI27_05780 [Alkalimarinus alittae]
MAYQREIHLPADSQVNAAISAAIDDADKLAKRSGCKMTVVRTLNYGICVYPDFKMIVCKHEIVEEIYNTENGFKFAETG